MPQQVSYSRRKGVGAMLLLVLLTIAIALIVYFGKFGGSGTSYVQTVVKGKERARDVMSDADLATIYRSLRVYAAGNDGKYPPTPEILAREANLPEGFIYLPSRPFDEHLAVYIGGQDESMPASNILIYQAEMAAEGTCQVLRLGGRVERITAEQVRQAIDQSQQHIRK